MIFFSERNVFPIAFSVKKGNKKSFLQLVFLLFLPLKCLFRVSKSLFTHALIARSQLTFVSHIYTFSLSSVNEKIDVMMTTESLKSLVAHQCHIALLRTVRHTLQQGIVNINIERCKGCGLCVATCPAQTLLLSDGINKRGYHYSTQVLPNNCIGCASCALICPDVCINVYRTSIVNRKNI